MNTETGLFCDRETVTIEAYTRYERCHFYHCDFSGYVLGPVEFVDCTFVYHGFGTPLGANGITVSFPESLANLIEDCCTEMTPFSFNKCLFQCEPAGFAPT